MADNKIINIIASVGVWDDQGRFLMVEEAKEPVRGLWSNPSGRLELNETIIEGAKREVLEETGCEVEITGICGVIHYQIKDVPGMSVRFCLYGRLIAETKKPLEKDILSCAWKTKEEVEEMIESGKIRSKITELVINKFFEGKVYPLEQIDEA